MDSELWRLYQEFQTQLEGLKRDIERISAIRQELAESGKVETTKLDELTVDLF